MTDEDHFISNWNLFKLLLWKNCLIAWNSRGSQIFSTLTPMIFCYILALLRVTVNVERVPLNYYEPIDLQAKWTELFAEIAKRHAYLDSNFDTPYTAYSPRPILAYSPDDVKSYADIMTEAIKDLQPLQLMGFSNCAALRSSMVEEHYFAGICFDEDIPATTTDSIYHIDGYPNRLIFTLVFPSELRLYNETYISSHWSTHTLYHPTDWTENRLWLDNDGGYVGYAQEGFITLQNAISRKYILLISKKTKLPEVKIQRFPFHPWDEDSLSRHLYLCLPLVFAAGHMYPLMLFAKQVVREKENQMNDVLSSIGVQNWLNVIAWFVHGTIVLVLSNFLVMVVLTVHWNDGFAVLTKSSIIPLFIFFTIVSMAHISFCLMICAFNTRSASVAFLVPLFYFLNYLPYETTRDTDSITIPPWVLYFFSVTVQCMALELILDYENFGDGFAWSSLTRLRMSYGAHGVGMLVFILCGLTLFYGLIGLYASPDTLILPRRVQAFLKRVCKPRLGGKKRRRHTTQTIVRRTKIEEIEAEGLCTIIIHEASKDFGDLKAIRKVSMNLYQDSITVLMGHNGAGKTTLLSMVMGILTPTEGSITIVGSTDENKAPLDTTMGIYLRASALYSNLSVADQLAFFCRVRGLSQVETEEEVRKYLIAMQLYEIKNMLTKHLSMGLRQQLAVCCALTGNTKIVILDDPSRNMDPSGQRRLWRLLGDEKHGRTILISTNDANEVQVLADRVAILSQGALNYCGSTLFLKNLYGQNYRLLCMKGQECDPVNVTRIIQKYIPDIEPASNLANELTYTIQPNQLENIAIMLDELEDKASELYIERYQIGESSLDDIFHQLGAEDPSEGEPLRQSEIMNGLSVYFEEYERLRFLQKEKCITGSHLLLCHCKSLILKRSIFMKKYISHVLVRLLLPVMVTWLTFSILSDDINRPELPLLNYNLDAYARETTITIVDTHVSGSHEEDDDTIFAGTYKQILNNMGVSHLLETTGDKPFAHYLLDRMERLRIFTTRRMFASASFRDDQITAWFNNYPLHTAPLSLNMVYNSILQTFIDYDARIIVNFHPLPYSTVSKNMLHETSMGADNVLALNLMICYCIILPYGVMFLVLERVMRYKQLQFISGCRLWTFWASSFIFDSTIVVLSAFVIIVTFELVETYNFDRFDVTVWYFVILVLSGCSIVSVSYLISTFPNDAINAYSLAVSYGLFGLVGCVSFLYVLNEGYRRYIEGYTLTEWFFRIFPPFSSINGLIKVFNAGALSSICNEPLITQLSFYEHCEVAPSCCEPIYMLHWNRRYGGNGLNLDILCLVIVGVVAWILLCLKERRSLWQSGKMPYTDDKDSISGGSVKYTADEEVGSEDVGVSDEVQNEMDKVMQLRKEDLLTKPLVCNQVSKYYGKQKGIGDLYLVVEREECIGLPTLSGAGITTIFHVLSGFEKMSYGDVYVKGYMLRSNLYEVYKHIGYCPAENPLPVEYTPEETLKMISLLHGIPPDEIDDLSRCLAKVLGFYDYYDKKLSYCSKGIKRRVCCAIAVLNSPSMILLDRPTASLDPSAKRMVWYVMDQLRRQNGCGMLFSSLSPKECEMLSTRLAIVSKARLIAIGTPVEFFSQHRKGYLLYIKMKKIVKNKRRLSVNLASFIESEFSQSVLKWQYSNILVFFIPYAHYRLSHIFTIIYRNAFSLYVETYKITGESFASIFHDILEEEEYLRCQKEYEIEVI